MLFCSAPNIGKQNCINSAIVINMDNKYFVIT